MAELFTDQASTTLAAGLSIGATSLTVQAGDGALFPAPTGSDFCTIFLFKKLTGESEFIQCDARTGDALTLAIAGTVYAYNAGDVVELRPTAAFFNALSAGASAVNIQQGGFLYGVDTGAADAYVIAMSPTATTLAAGQEIRVKIDTGNTNTGACTLKVDALTAIDIKTASGANPVAGSIRAGFTHTFHYDGTNMVMQNTGLSLTSAGFNAEAKQIKNALAGTDSGDVSTIDGTEDLSNKTITGSTMAGGHRFIQTPREFPFGTPSVTPLSDTWTGIPSWATRIEINIQIDDTSTVYQQDRLRMRIGPVGGVETTGYKAMASNIDDFNNVDRLGSTSFFPLCVDTVDIGNEYHSHLVLSRYDTSTHKWVLSGQAMRWVDPSVDYEAIQVFGEKTLAGALERIEIYTITYGLYNDNFWNITWS